MLLFKVHSEGLKDAGRVLAKLTCPVAGAPVELVTVDMQMVDTPSWNSDGVHDKFRTVLAGGISVVVPVLDVAVVEVIVDETEEVEFMEDVEETLVEDDVEEDVVDCVAS